VNADSKILKVKNLCKHFPIYTKGLIRRLESEVKAVDQVSFELTAGMTLGLVGESGCGKTTTCRTILRALKPTSGEILFKGNGKYIDLAKVGSKQLRSLRQKMQMIFQDPFSSLNPRMTVGSIVGESLVIHKMARASELEDRIAEMLKKVGLQSEHAKRFPHAFSGGQRQRIGIARALIMRPSLVVCDEAVSALDVSVQAQIINLLEDLQDEFGLTYIFVAHDLSVVRHISDNVAVMYAGRIVELGKTEAIFEDPKHPYTKALLAAVPHPDPDKKLTSDLGGEPPDLANLPSGCSFHPRCPKKFEPCSKTSPPLTEICEGRCVACHLYF
jgi:oligopeptide/dipeptide ABC transporter ATP-binding protein